jgi:signal peptidase I
MKNEGNGDAVKLIKMTLRYAGNTFIVGMLVLAMVSLTSMVKAKNVEKYIPGIGAYKFMAVLSGSMSPVFNTYDLIVDRVYKAGEFQGGEIITFWKENMLVTHRIVDVVRNENSTLYKTKGDSNNAPDEELIRSDEIAGTYLFRIPYLGYVIAKMKGPMGIGIIWSLFIYAAVMEMGKEVLKNNKERNYRRNVK